MKIEKLEDDFLPSHSDTVRVKQMGNIVEVMYCEKKNSEIYIKKISDSEYIDLRTGEVKECNKIENRACNINSVRQSLCRLRDYINANVTDTKKCKWITLTYKENMTDVEQLYKDFKKFNMRLRYQLSKDNLSYEYIVAMEPQGRGAWHAHLLLIFDTVAPYISNNFIANTWGHGFTVTKKLDNVDNVGAYLTAYLGDMDFVEFNGLSEEDRKGLNISDIKEVEIEGVKKAIVKGARLHMYPPKFNLYRCSRGIKKPIITYETEKDAQKKVSAGTLTFKRTIKISDTDSNYSNHINYRYYNKLR